jgi:hypothetical protein
MYAVARTNLQSQHAGMQAGMQARQAVLGTCLNCLPQQALHAVCEGEGGQVLCGEHLPQHIHNDPAINIRPARMQEQTAACP